MNTRNTRTAIINIPQRINDAMQEGIKLRQASIIPLTRPLQDAALLLANCLRQHGKVLLCGNGGSAADAQHFAAELVNRFMIERDGLAAIAMTHDASVITSIANDYSFEQIFSRQVQALGREGDVLIAISTSGNSANVLAAIDAACKTAMKIIVLYGKDGGKLAQHIAVDVHLHIQHQSTARIQEMHITCLHILCDLLDEYLFGNAVLPLDA